MGLFSTLLHLASATSGTEACLGRAQVTQWAGLDPQCLPMLLVVSRLSTLTCGSVLRLTKEINSWRVKPVKSVAQRLYGTETESSVDKKTCYHCHRYHDEELKTTKIWKTPTTKENNCDCFNSLTGECEYIHYTLMEVLHVLLLKERKVIIIFSPGVIVSFQTGLV